STKPSERQRWIALIVLCVGMLMIVLDATIVNVALPSIQGDLGFSQSSLAWVVNAYLITFGGLLLLAGRLGDLLGRRRVLMTGLAVFIGASLLCAVSDSQALLLGAFVVRESRIENPLMPLRLFRSRNVAGANIVQALFVAGMFGMFFLGALYLQKVLGYKALGVGLAFLPVTVVIGTLSLGFSEKLTTRYGPKA